MSTRPRIVTVSLNAAIDQTVSIPNFAAGEVNRVAWEQSDAGGKAVNVASFLADVGHTVAVTGILGSENQERFLRLFGEKRLIDRFVRVPGRTRVNIKVVDEVRRQVTDINFPGVTAGAKAIDAVIATIDVLAEDGAELFVLSGSLPVGVGPTIYRDITTRLKTRGCKVALDTSGEALAHAIEAAPDIIKPNIDELAELVGHALDSEAAIVAAARALREERGVDWVVVSMGDQGAIFVTGDAAIRAVPPPVSIRSTVGAGDAMVAGALHAILQNLDVAACARLATAFSLGALGGIGANLPPHDAIEALARQVRTRRIVG
ncbi:MAG: 1-phosphofructokinase [Xanthobacteraceae bacterium]